ncbi:hypothetical protein [Halobaculum sp. P14]|uniref:hypothetical protein n=1 Tax=Halobaculum sp. P14 TaxID=3421638 RepID=UPI003EB73E7D
MDKSGSSEREEQSQLVESLVKCIPNPNWADRYEVDEEELEQSRLRLTATYQEIGSPLICSLVSLLVLLAVLDLFVVLSTQIYGLYIDVLAAIFFLTPSLKSPVEIAASVEEIQGPVRRMESEEMVAHNVGFSALLVGFGMQIFAVQSARSELLGQNYLSGMPDLVGGIGLILVGVLSLTILGKLRGYFRSKHSPDSV